MNVALYIYDDDNVRQRIDTFKDETIQVTSSVQNINDISKVFTDYSQSFTVPASDNNNEIFTHWYDGIVDDGFLQTQKYNGFIEIDTEIFRIGVWQLEGAEVEDNKPKNYKITFYGVLKSLTDKFGKDKLRDLTSLQDLTFEYTAANVRTRIQTENDIIFPLISSKRVWQYGGGGANDISTNGHGIVHTELFPALRVSKIFEAIETKYNINFSGALLGQTRFTKMFLWLKNSDNLNVLSTINGIDITTTSNNAIFNTTINTYTHIGFLNSAFVYNKLLLTVFVPAGTTYTIFAYRNGIFFGVSTFTDSIGDEVILNQTSIDENAIYNGVWTFRIQTSVALPTIAIAFKNQVKPSTLANQIENTCTAVSTTFANLDVPVLMPDMPIVDFFSGILKVFNMTAISFDEVNYQLEQLEDWYLQGGIKDITQYTTTDVKVDRVKVFKNINFKYQKSNSFINENHRASFNTEYGDLTITSTNDGADYNVQLPFEKLQFARIGPPVGVLNGSLNVAYSLQSPDFKPYIPKPVLFYLWENRNMPSIYVSGTQLTNYLVCGDFTQFNLQFHSNNWGQEQSIQTGGQLPLSLFANYYANYITGIYDKKNRIHKVKAILPTIELVRLKLNDRLIIRDTRYIINNFTTNLLTGVVDFELIKDFRDALAIVQRTYTIPSGGGTIDIPILDSSENFALQSGGGEVDLSFAKTGFILQVVIDPNAEVTEESATVVGDKGSIINIILKAP